jgi:hypothetical protein
MDCIVEMMDIKSPSPMEINGAGSLGGFVLSRKGKSAHRVRAAILGMLKALVYLGYVPEKLNSIPGEVRSFIEEPHSRRQDHKKAVPR